jgi:hypothetical protein
VFAKDGVHPNTTGHFIMAKTILLYLGAEEFKQAKDILSVLSQYKNGTEILAHTITLQKITKDAWLTFVGHERPKMRLGVSMEEACILSNELKIKIQKLVSKK